MPNFPYILNWCHPAQMYTVQPLTPHNVLMCLVPHTEHTMPRAAAQAWLTVCVSMQVYFELLLMLFSERKDAQKMWDTVHFFFQNTSWQHILNNLLDPTELCFISHQLRLHNFWDVDFSLLLVLQRHRDHHTQSQEDQQSFLTSEY